MVSHPSAHPPLLHLSPSPLSFIVSHFPPPFPSPNYYILCRGIIFLGLHQCSHRPGEPPHSMSDRISQSHLLDSGWVLQKKHKGDVETQKKGRRGEQGKAGEGGNTFRIHCLSLVHQTQNVFCISQLGVIKLSECWE